jgi:hypothetical protein
MLAMFDLERSEFSAVPAEDLRLRAKFRHHLVEIAHGLSIGPHASLCD